MKESEYEYFVWIHVLVNEYYELIVLYTYE